MKPKIKKDEIRLTIKRGLFDKRPCQLILNPNFIQFEDKDLTKFNKNSITGYRYGIKWIIDFWVFIGRKYQIFIQNKDDQILEICFKSYFGIKGKKLNECYNKILYTLWVYYFEDIESAQFLKIIKGEKFIFTNVNFTKDKISFTTQNGFKDELREISWENLGLEAFQSEFCIFASDNPAKVYKFFSYIKDWNSEILCGLIKNGITLKKVERYSQNHNT